MNPSDCNIDSISFYELYRCIIKRANIYAFDDAVRTDFVTILLLDQLTINGDAVPMLLFSYLFNFGTLQYNLVLNSNVKKLKLSIFYTQ